MDGGSRPKFQHHRPATSVVRLEAVFLKSPALQRQQGRDPNRCKANPRVENHAPLPRALTTNMRVSTHEAAVGPTYPTHLGLPFCSRSPSSSEAHQGVSPWCFPFPLFSYHGHCLRIGYVSSPLWNEGQFDGLDSRALLP
eukprot:scaffold461_cov321-Pavlova_lutheri.AAC.48